MNINDYVFHFNKHTKIWAAIPRDLYKEYWNGQDSPLILKAVSMDILLDFLTK